MASSPDNSSDIIELTTLITKGTPEQPACGSQELNEVQRPWTNEEIRTAMNAEAVSPIIKNAQSPSVQPDFEGAPQGDEQDKPQDDAQPYSQNDAQTLSQAHQPLNDMTPQDSVQTAQFLSLAGEQPVINVGINDVPVNVALNDKPDDMPKDNAGPNADEAAGLPGMAGNPPADAPFTGMPPAGFGQIYEELRAELLQDVDAVASRLNSLEVHLNEKYAADARMSDMLQTYQNQLNLATTRLNSLNKEVQQLAIRQTEELEKSEKDGQCSPEELAARIHETVSAATTGLEDGFKHLREEFEELIANGCAKQGRLTQIEDNLRFLSDRLGQLEYRLNEMEKHTAHDTLDGAGRVPAEAQAETAQDKDSAAEKAAGQDEAAVQAEALAARVQELEQQLAREMLLQEEKEKAYSSQLAGLAARLEACEQTFTEEKLEQLVAGTCSRILREEILRLAQNS